MFDWYFENQLLYQWIATCAAIVTLLAMGFAYNRAKRRRETEEGL